MEPAGRRSPGGRLEMGVAIENFGPIRSGQIELRPLTIFMGSNNSGKSYAALLIHSILNGGHRSMRQIIDRGIVRRMRRADLRQDGPPLASFSLECDANLACQEFTQELQRNFSSPLSDLVSYKQETCTIYASSRILRSTITLQKGKGAKCDPTDNWNGPVTVDYSRGCPPITIDGDDNVTVNADIATDSSLLNETYEYCNAIAPLSHYVPASRQGVLQNHKLLLSGYARGASYVGTGDSRAPKLSGSTTDLLNALFAMPREHGPCRSIARRLESSTLGGRVTISDDEFFPEVTYQHGGRVVPMHRAASAVSSIAPLVLYLKYLVKPGHALIIEEPEAHLNPKQQIALAGCLVDLVRSGVYILISTHSPYVVEQMGNYLRAGGVSDKTKLPGNQDRYIKRDEFAAYSFEPDQGASVVKSVAASEDGIDQEQFVAAFEAISSHARAIEGL